MPRDPGLWTSSDEAHAELLAEAAERRGKEQEVSTTTMRFTFPDGEEQEHTVPYPLLRVVKLIQRRDLDIEIDGSEPRLAKAVTFRLVRFADSTGREWAEYHVDR